MRTFIEVLRDNAVYESHAHTFVRMDGSEHSISFPDLWRQACARAHRFRELGLEKGDRVALILPEPEDFVLTFLGALTAGVVAVPMYPPLTLAKMEAYGETVRHILRASGAKALVTVPGLKSMLETHLVQGAGRDGVRVLLDSDFDVEASNEPAVPPCQVTPDDIAFLQFTSGSTRKPKGVMVSHHNLSVNAHAVMFDGLRANAHDRGVTWLPLFHDMGLIGFVIAPLFAQVQVMFLPTMNFIRRPSTWLEAVHRFRGTITFAPNFAFSLATRAIKEADIASWDLSCLKAVGCGAEPIHPEVVRSFVDRFAAAGLKPEALLPCYGLAEATLGVTFLDLASPMKTDRVVAESMKLGRAESAVDAATERRATLELVSCGTPFACHELAIVDDGGRALPERHVGRVMLRGPSITQGYFGQPDATAETFRDGWLDTGDLGYLAAGELYVCGRAKDLIIINGKNYYPQDIERIASEVQGVRHDQCIAVARSGKGGEECVVVCEVVKAPSEPGSIESTIKQRVRSDLGVTVADVVLIKKNTMPKTSSGKVRRRETKARLEDGTLELYEMTPRRRAPLEVTPEARPSAPAL
jgi:fatty-acyl-CoA synthase